jgi:hypothetical protein
MHQPEWLDRVRRMMRGVIERAVAEERVSLLHLAARQTDAMAPENFDRQDEKRGVDALLHAMANMTHEQLDEWQMLTGRGPAWARHEAEQRATAGEQPAAMGSDGQQPADAGSFSTTATGETSAVEAEANAAVPMPHVDAAAAPSLDPRPAPPFDDAADPDDDMKAALRERCPWPGHAGARGGSSPDIPARGFLGTPEPTPEQKGDPLLAPAPAIRPPEPPRPDPWPWPSDPLAVPQGAMLPPRPPGGWDPRLPIPMPRSVLARVPPGRRIPDWIDQEPPGRWRQRPT